jgi:hypothetical protein
VLILWWFCLTVGGVSPSLEKKEMMEELLEILRVLLCSRLQSREGKVELWQMSSISASPL